MYRTPTKAGVLLADRVSGGTVVVALTCNQKAGRGSLGKETSMVIRVSHKSQVPRLSIISIRSFELIRSAAVAKGRNLLRAGLADGTMDMLRSPPGLLEKASTSCILFLLSA